MLNQMWNSIYNAMPQNGQVVIGKIESNETVKILCFEVFKPAGVGSINCEFKDESGNIYPIVFWMALPSLPAEEMPYER
jgi:hypothetical protein